MNTQDTWTIVNTDPDRKRLAQFNGVCTISNGYFGLSGNVGEQRDGRQPVTLINGVYDELDMLSLIRPSNQPRPYLDPRYFDTGGKSPAVANLPDPLCLRAFVSEREISLGRGEVSGFEQTLDLRTGVYRYRFDFRDGWKHVTRVEMQRFASLSHPHRAYMRYSLTPVDHCGAIRVDSGIDGRARSNTVPERQYGVAQLWADPPQRCRMLVRTRAREIEVHVGVAHAVRAGQLAGDPVGVAEHDAVYTRYGFTSRPSEAITIDRFVALTCSEDLQHRVVGNLEGELGAAADLGFDAALERQRVDWEALWRRSDVQIDSDERAQRYLRFCLHHLLAAAPRFGDRLSVPVKLLSGEHYQGNVFYDTDLMIVPFYTFTQPKLARSCLRFRHEGLRPGREIARSLGHRGVKFAWQAGPRGEECLGPWWRFVHTNIHVNAGVACALMQYCAATGDDAFLHEHGVDILVETARFYASRAEYDKSRDAYDIHGVAGPDEGHCESTNNFYTNYVAGRSLHWAADVLDRLAEDDPRSHASIAGRLALAPDETDEWRHVAERLTLLFDPETKVYEQYDGFNRLRPKPADLLDHRKAWFVTVAPYQALNQPDVLMALALFRGDFDAEVLRANWAFYKDKSLDFSSMSHAFNALMAVEVGDSERAYREFIVSAGMDLDESLTGRHDTHLGLHGTAMGGAWMAAVLGFGGVSLTEEGLAISPRLPREWSGLRFTLEIEGVAVRVEIDAEEVRLTAGSERRIELPVVVGGNAITLRSGQSAAVPYRGD